MKISKISPLLAICGVSMLSPALHGAFILGSTSDLSIQVTDTGATTLRPVGNTEEVIRIGGNSGREFIYVFQLPALGMVSNPFQSANFNFSLLENGGNSVPLIAGGAAFSAGSTPSFNIDLYGLGARTTSAVAADDAYFSATPDPTDATLLMADFLTSASAVGTKTYSAANLTTYLNAQYDGGNNAGQFIFLRLNPDAAVSNISNTQLYRVSAADNAATTYAYIAPVINFTAIPEPSAFLLVGIGALALLGRRRA